MPHRPQNVREFTLSLHAKDRLSERSTLSADALLSILNQRIYKRVHTEYYRNLTKEDVAYFADAHGLTPKELKEYGILNELSTVEHLLVWSAWEQQFLLCLATSATGYVLTVLHEPYLLDRFTDGRISERHREIAKSRFEKINRPDQVAPTMEVASRPAQAAPTMEVAIRWTTAEGTPRAKVFTAARLGLPADARWSADQIRTSLCELLQGASNINIIVRPRGRPELVDYEYVLP